MWREGKFSVCDDGLASHIGRGFKVWGRRRHLHVITCEEDTTQSVRKNYGDVSEPNIVELVRMDLTDVGCQSAIYIEHRQMRGMVPIHQGYGPVE